jgi:hypothetical protein
VTEKEHPDKLDHRIRRQHEMRCYQSFFFKIYR